MELVGVLRHRQMERLLSPVWLVIWQGYGDNQ